MTTKAKSNGFSIIEVLSVIAVISILAGLFIPSFLSARAKARQTKCINNQYQLAKAMIMYATDTEKFPTTLAQLNQGYLENDAPEGYSLLASPVFTANYYDNALALKICPEASRYGQPSSDTSYGLNSYILGKSYGSITNPSTLVLTADSSIPVLEKADQASNRHCGKALASYADGHVEWIRELAPHQNSGHGNNADHDDENNPGQGIGGHGHDDSTDTGSSHDGYDDDELGGNVVGGGNGNNGNGGGSQGSYDDELGGGVGSSSHGGKK